MVIQRTQSRILHLEDSARDAALIQDLLEAAGGAYQFCSATNRGQFAAALEQSPFDLILCDFNLPEFDGLTALKHAKEKYPETPVIMVSGAIDAEDAVQCLKAGATDYLLKQRLERLPSAVGRALSEAEEFRAHRKAEQRLAQERELSETILENMPGLFFLFAEDGQILRWNHQVEEITGYSDAEIARMQPLDFFPSEHKEMVAARIAEVFEKGSCEVEAELLTKLGVRWPFYFSGASVVVDGRRCLAGAGIDISGRKKADDILRASQMRMTEQAKMISSVRDAVIVCDLDQRIYFWNAGAERLYGWTAQEAFGRKANALFYTDKNTTAPMEEILRTGEWRGELSQRIKGGREIVVESFCSLIADESGKPAGVLSINTDITARKEAELARSESERFAKASLDALAAHVAILDSRGVIIAVNSAWRNFAQANGANMERTTEGANYIEICERAGGSAASVAVGIRSVISRETDEFTIEYPCHSQEEQRWFLCRVTRFTGAGPVCVAVAHENVTLVKKVQEQVEESNEIFRSLARVAPVGIFRMDERGRCTYVNRHWRIMTGLCDEKALGKGWRAVIHHEDRAQVIREWNVAIRSGRPFRSECRIEKADGTFAWAVIQAAKLVGANGRALGYVGTIFNVTAQKQTEIVLRTLSSEAAGLCDEELFQFVARRLAETLGVEFGVVGRLDGEMKDRIQTLPVWADGRFSPNYSYDVPGTPCENVFAKELCIYPEAVLEQFPRDMRLAKMGILSYGGIPLRGATGQLLGLLFVMSRRPMRDPQQVESILKLFAARTAAEIERGRATCALQLTARELREAKMTLEIERARLAERVTERTAELSVANANLERANRLKTEFLANMSHELRTPLNAILGLSETLMEQAATLTPRQLRSTTIIHTSGQHLLTLINDILDLSKIEAGKFELFFEPVDVESLCKSSIAFVQTQAMKKQINVSYKNNSLLTDFVADPKRLKQILVNLLSNAVKFTPAGGSIGLIVNASLEDELIRFTVWDTGIGITREDASRLFRAFTQVDSGLNRAQEGTGLGLALVAKLADLHCGSVALESEPGEGSRFTVTLPIQQCPLEAVLPTRKHSRAMIIEDDSKMAAILTQYLADLGFHSILFENGEDVLDAIIREQPDIVLLDIMLPGQSGFEILKQAKANTIAHDIPFLVVSGAGDPEKSCALGAAGHLSKPFTYEKFVECMGLAMKSKRLAVPPSPPGHSLATGDSLILLAEDNEANIETIGGYLDQKGHKLRYAANGIDAVKLAKELHPALILMDVQMPLMDGLTAIREIRVIPTLQDIPIIALTGLAMPGDRERCITAGANDYLSKPVSLRELHGRVRHFLRMHASA